MIKKLSSVVLLSGSLMVGLVTAPVLLMPVNVWAEEEAASASPRVRRTQTLRPVIYEKLEKAREQMDGGDAEQALQTLNKLSERKRNSYETAMTHNMFAYVYSTTEQFGKATAEYEAILGINNVPDSLVQTTRFTLAQLYMMQEKFDESLSTLNSWMESADAEKVGADAYLLRAQVQYQRKAYESSLDDVKTAIAKRADDGKVAPENWYLLQRATLFQLKDFNGLEKNLEALVANYPKAEYWVQLAAVFNENGKPEQELAALETAYDQKLLTKERELINFAQALLGMEIPFKAGQVLEKGMQDGVVEESTRNLSLLGDAWMIAKEYDKAIVAMTKAAQESGKGSDYFKLAQIYTQRQEWNNALDFAQKSIDSGDLKAPYQALIIKGLAQFNLDKLESAAATFFQAGRYPEAEKTAHQWQEFIEGEQARREYLASAEES